MHQYQPDRVDFGAVNLESEAAMLPLDIRFIQNLDIAVALLAEALDLIVWSCNDITWLRHDSEFMYCTLAWRMRV